MAADTRYQVLKPNEHGHLALRARHGYDHMAASRWVPVVAEELRDIVRYYVTPFRVEDDQARLIALMGTESGENLYVMPDGRWLGDHVPAYCRGYPFGALSAHGKSVLTLDTHSDWITDDASDDAEALFDASGAPSPLLKRHMQFIERRERGRMVLERASQELYRLGLLKPWRPDPAVLPGHFERLYCVDEAAVNQLAPETLGVLRDCSALPMIYAHLLSLTNVDRLAKRLTLRQKMQQSVASRASEAIALDDDDWTLDFDD